MNCFNLFRSSSGRSFTWEFGVELPQRRGYALLSVGPSGRGEDIDDNPIVLVQRLRPLSTEVRVIEDMLRWVEQQIDQLVDEAKGIAEGFWVLFPTLNHG